MSNKEGSKNKRGLGSLKEGEISIVSLELYGYILDDLTRALDKIFLCSIII